MTTQTPPEPAREKSGIPKNPGRRDLGMRATLLFPDREIVERFYVPIIYTACRTCYSEQDPDEIFRRAARRRLRPAQDAEAHRLGHRVRPRLHDRARRLHVRHQRRLADAVAPARPPPGGRRLRPAEPALRQVQGRGDDAPPLHRRGRPGRCASATRRRSTARSGCTASCSAAGVPGEDARFVFPNATRTNLVMTTNLRALIHMSGPAPVHDGPVGDPPAVPADPPRDLRRLAVPRVVPRARSACRSATATSSTTATGTAPSGRTRTGSSRPGPRRPPRPRRPDGSCRSPDVRACAGARAGDAP